jgi:protein LSM14
MQVPTKSLEDANRDARAAVAAAMAKLPPAPGQKKQTNTETNAMDNLTKKVNEMRTNDNIRTSRQPGTGGYAAGHRGGRGGHRGGRPRDEQTRKMEVPKTDYDFAEANAKFNKQDLVKEAIATGDTIGSPIDGSNDASAEASINGARRGSEQGVTIPSVVGYNKSSSFFDNISSESKDRDDKRLGGREFRSEEQRKNLETFGQGSVDNGYRGGFRGRGRGRGFRGQRGSFSGRGRGSARGNGAVAAES